MTVQRGGHLGRRRLGSWVMILRATAMVLAVGDLAVAHVTLNLGLLIMETAWAPKRERRSIAFPRGAEQRSALVAAGWLILAGCCALAMARNVLMISARLLSSCNVSSARRASSGDLPRAMFCSISFSRWKRSSALRSASAWRRKRNLRLFNMFVVPLFI